MSSDGAESGAAPFLAGSAPGDRDLAEDLATCALDLARRFACGGRMFAVAPAWAEHARHVAVEFVHPVIVGKRALPAFAIEGSEPGIALRANVASGDILVTVGDARTAGVLPLLRRAEAWGMTTVWIGAGERPPPGSADHVLWLDGGAGGAARHDGSVVRIYHLLWELTHVCLEHSGPVGPVPPRHRDRSCTTCADEGRPAEVLSLDGDSSASVRTAAGVETVDTTLVAPLDVGALVLVHAGAVIAVLPEERG